MKYANAMLTVIDVILLSQSRQILPDLDEAPDKREPKNNQEKCTNYTIITNNILHTPQKGKKTEKGGPSYFIGHPCT